MFATDIFPSICCIKKKILLSILSETLCGTGGTTDNISLQVLLFSIYMLNIWSKYLVIETLKTEKKSKLI